jgi:uncharacterized protein YfaS (alpha-2-macroglobulin family)
MRTQSVSVSVPTSNLQVGANQVTLARTPAEGGKLYYSLVFRYAPPTTELPAESHGLSVAREYVSGDAVHVGDMVKIRLTVVAPRVLTHVVLEDPLPAGLEAVDTQLAITSLEAQQTLQADARQGQTNWWSRYALWSHIDVRGDRVVVFATYLAPGTHTYENLARASVAGTFNMLPTSAYEQYFPDIFARTDGRQFTITPAP